MRVVSQGVRWGGPQLLLPAVVLLAAVMAGCASPSADQSPDASPQPTAPSAEPPGTGGADQAPIPGPAATVPVTLCDFADPSVPTANRSYPFAEPLTAQTGLSADPAVVAAVRSIQEVLRAQGFTGAEGQDLVVDGDYGPATAAAVRQYQRQAGIAADGAVGQQTWESLAVTFCWRYH